MEQGGLRRYGWHSVQRIGERFRPPVVQAGFISRPFLVIVGVAVLATIFYYPFSPAGAQSREMNKAKAHIPVVQRALANDPRFSRVSFDPSYSGSLHVYGTVPTNKDIDDLKKIVASTSPPTGVSYGVLSQEQMDNHSTTNP